MYYLNIENELIVGGSENNNSRFATETNFQVEVAQLVYEDWILNTSKYIYDKDTNTISVNPNYETEQLEKAKTLTYYKIISKYDQAIKNGVFKIDSEYYGNMSWYDTWSKAVSLYESGLVLSDTFTVRLYKSPTSEDGVYYNYNTTQTLSSFKSMLQTLNSRQFLLYQPIRNNLISQLKLATTIEEVSTIENLIDSSFGDIIDENTTIVQDRE